MWLLAVESQEEISQLRATTAVSRSCKLLRTEQSSAFKWPAVRKAVREPLERPLDSRLPKEKVLLILHCLVEGNSIRSTARIADVKKRTVINLVLSAGENCERILESRIRNVR
jgi:DNA-directed RNA polymerase specialized sigma24 family protein